jgi:hypothetical protein
MEEYSYRYPRLKSYSQYLMYDDRARSGSSALRWAGFQTGLRFSSGRAKPSFVAFKLPLVVNKRGHGVSIWGHVRPGSGRRYVQLQRRAGGSFVNAGAVLRTNSGGYFTAKRGGRGPFRYEAFSGPPSAATSVGFSRTAVAR